MSYFYYQVLKKIQEHVSTTHIIFVQFIQIFFYGFVIQIFFDIFRLYSLGKEVEQRVFYNYLLIILAARGITVYIRHKISSTTPFVKKQFPEKDRRRLIKEIEKSIQKSIEFSKWSCGIFATVLTLTANVYSNILLKVADKIIPFDLLKQELKLTELNTNNFYLLFFFTVALIAGLVLFYYLLLQSLTYHRRLVLKILKNCEYDTSYCLSGQPISKIAGELLKEMFLWNYLKNMF